MDLANLMKSAPFGDMSLTGETAFSRPVGDGAAFAEALSAAQQKISGHRDLVNTVMTNKNLTQNTAVAKTSAPFARIPLDTSRSGDISTLGPGSPQSVATEAVDSAFSFKRGWTGVSEMVEMATAQNTPGQPDLPQSYKKQLGVGMLVRGQEGLSAESMLAGATLMNSHSPAEALREVFSSLGATRDHLKLDREALNDLGQVLADSGLNNEEVNNFISGVAASGFSVKEIYTRLEQLDLSQSPERGLEVNPDGLAALGQFLSGVGVKPEVIDEFTSQFELGDKITAADLRSILTAEDGAPLAPCLTETDARNLEAMLKSMGVSQGDMERMSAMLGQNKGKTSSGDVLNFLEGLEAAPAKAVTGAELKLVKNILDSISREQELVKAPVFEETLVKLQALGDQDIDEDFVRMSPALQALRGGVSGLNRQDTAFGGQGDQNGQSGGQPGQGQNGQPGQGGQQDGREAREQFQRNMAAVNNEAAPAAVAEVAKTAQSYGSQGQESLARQISQKIAYSHRKGIHRLKMNLNPADMGRLDIELKVQGDQLVAHIRAQNRETYEALSGEIESLKTALAEGGVEISNLTLAFDDQESGRSEFADLKSLKEQAQAAEAQNQPLSGNAAAYQGGVYRVI